MDNLTHALVGAALSAAGPRRRTPYATATLVLGANAPDVDVFGHLAGGEYFGLAFRRGITHGVPALLLLPFVVAGVVLAWDRYARGRDPAREPARPGPLLALAALGVITHPVLDWMNVYGMRWLLPFDGRWTYGDALFIIDPWLWLGLGAAVFLSGIGSRALWAFLALLTTVLMFIGPVPLGARVAWALGVAGVVVRTFTAGRTLGEVGARKLVAGCVAYIGVMVGSNLVAQSTVARNATELGLDVREVLVSPLPANPFAAEVEVVTPDGYVPGSHAWLPRPMTRIHLEEQVPLLSHPMDLDMEGARRIVETASLQPDVRDYRVWARYPYVRIERAVGGWRVSISDARYDGAGSAGSLAGVVGFVPEGD